MADHVTFDAAFDADAYRDRIALPARPTLDHWGLAALQRAHRLAIPFENLDVILGREIAIDPAGVFAKLVTARRGGYCFEQDRLFRDALAAFGFAARPLLARVLLGATEPPPLTHTFSLVTIDGQDWIADAGFGGGYAPPMPLVDGAEGASPDGARFALRRDGDAWTLLREGPAAGGAVAQYVFDLRRVEQADLAMSHHWTSTARASRFCRHRIVSIVLPHGFARLTDRAYHRRAAGQETHATIDDPRVYRMRLGIMFGIALPKNDATTLFPAS